MDEWLYIFFKRYLPRNEIAYRLPVGLPIGEFWQAELTYRRARGIELPLSTSDGRRYMCVMTDDFARAADHLALIARTENPDPNAPAVMDDDVLIDEAYFSALVDGAVCERSRAHELITGNEAPGNEDEQMVFDTYVALRFALEHLDAPVNEPVILEIGRILSEDVAGPGAKGGYREGAVYAPIAAREIVSAPPRPERVRIMMRELLRYIADPDIHPVIKACVSHIALVTICPFPSGNERAARVLSYLILLQAGYNFLCGFPISGVLSQERDRYYKAVRASQDPVNGYDFTYFMEYYAGMIERGTLPVHAQMAARRHADEVKRKVAGAADGERIARGVDRLIEEDVATITTEEWRKRFKVSFETARQDLIRLVDAGFLTRRTVGRKAFYDVVRND